MSSLFSFLDNKFFDNKNLHPQESAVADSDPVERQWKDFKRLYQENEKVFRSCESVDTVWASKNDKAPELEIAIDSFASTANVVLEGFVRLANLHPVFGVAISAYHSLITLDLTTASGYRKVLLVLLQMQAMMCTLFQLRHVKSIRVRTEAEKTSLLRLVAAIATDIIKCGSDLNYYLSRNSPAKRLWVIAFEKRFMAHINLFIKRRKELQYMFEKLDIVPVPATWANVKDIGTKFINLAVNGETPQQVEHRFQRFLRNFVEGLRTRDESEDVSLINAKLANMKKDPSGAQIGILETYLGFVCTLEEFEQAGYVAKAIVKMLSGNINEKLDNHLPRFKKLLDIQGRVLGHSLVRMQQQTQHMRQSDMKVETPFIISVPTLDGKKRFISLDTATTVKDPEVHHIWTRMNFGPSVKTQDFMLQFRDYFAQDKSCSNDNWIMDYVNLAHVQPMTEAMSGPGSEFVDARQIHEFALSRPDGLSLSHCLAYWAAGWRINIINYRDQVYSIIRQMHDAFGSIHIANRGFVGVYLGSPFFIRIESLFRSITLISGDQNTSNDPRLVELAYYVAHLQEEEIIANLKDVSYILESATEARLVGGPGRVETWILPLLYLLLQRHLSIIKIAQSCVLDKVEMMVHTQSLVSIFRVFESRIRELEATLKLEEKQNTVGQFETRSYGMFHTYIDKQRSMSPKMCTLSTFRNASAPPKYNKPSKEKINISILAKGPGQPFEYHDIDRTLPTLIQRTNPLEGAWYGSAESALQINIRSSGANQSFIGNGETFTSQVKITGKVEPDTREDGNGRLNVYFKIFTDGIHNLLFKGQYNLDEDTIEGEVGSFEGEDGDDVDSSFATLTLSSDPNLCQALTFTRTSPAIGRFKYLLAESNVDASWSRARRRWAFATEAVLHQAQTKMYSSKLIKRGLQDRRNWTATIIRTGVQPAQDSVEKVLRHLPAENARLYTNLKQYLLNRLADSIGGIQCDGCDKMVKVTRFNCITCRNEDIAGNAVDLCSECVDTPQLGERYQNAFSHHTSHSLIRTSSHITHFELFELVRQARILSEDIKRSFREIRESVGSNEPPIQPSVSSLKCACCDIEIALPCLVCITCSLHPLICLECDEKREYIRRENASFAIHSRRHRFLRIKDCAPVDLEIV